MWVVGEDDTLYAYNVTDRSRDPDRDFGDELNAVGNNSPQGIWSDGATMWVADDYDGKLYAYNLATRQHDPDKDLIVSQDRFGRRHQPLGIWSDGTTMWVTYYDRYVVDAYELATNKRVRDKDITTTHVAGGARVWTNFRGLWSDGTTLLLADSWDRKIYAYHLETGNASPRRTSIH